jgi:host cell factor
MTWYQGPEGSGSPSARFGHSSNLIGGSKMLIFGGWNGKDFFNDVFLLDLEVMAWTQP